MLINKTPFPLLERVSDSRQITNLGSVFKYISCCCSILKDVHRKEV